MKRLKRVLGSVKNLTKDEFGGSSSSVLSRLTNPRSVASKSSLENRNEFSKDGAYMGYDFQSSPLHGSHLIDYSDPLSYADHLATKLHKYCFIGDVNKVKKSLKKVNINSQDSEGRTPLHLAAAGGHLDVVLVLMGERVNPEIEDFDGRTPFLIAVERNQIEVVQSFLKYKVSGLAKDKYGNECMHLAARTGAKDVMDLLIDAGLDVNTVNVLDQTPLHIATENLNIDVVKSLLSCQLDVNAIDKESVTALMLAAKTGSNPLVESLLDGGADLSMVDSSGWNAASYAKYSMHEELEQQLVLMTSSDVTEGRPEEYTQSLDRSIKRHVRSISETYDSWTESSMSESQKLKLTYFNADMDNSASSKTLPRQRLSSSSIGPPKPPRLYTSTPNLDLNEGDLEAELNSEIHDSNRQCSSRFSKGNNEMSCDNTLKSDISFENDQNIFDLSEPSERIMSVGNDHLSENRKEPSFRQLECTPSKSFSLSPKSSSGQMNISIDGKGSANNVQDNNTEPLTFNEDSVGFSNKDVFNEIGEVWESNAHLSSGWSVNVQSTSASHSAKEDIGEQTNVLHPELTSPSNVIYNQSYAASVPPLVFDAHNSNDSEEKMNTKSWNEDEKDEDPSVSLLLSSATPTNPEELQGLVRKLRNALKEINISSKAKDHDLTSLKKSESFLKTQLKEIENKTNDLAMQNTDFLHRLESLQTHTSALKDEANSVCHSLEEANHRFLVGASGEYITTTADINDLSGGPNLQETRSLSEGGSADIHYESVNKKARTATNMERPQKNASTHYSMRELQAQDSDNPTLAKGDLEEMEPNVTAVTTIEVAVQATPERYMGFESSETQTDIAKSDEMSVCSRGMNTDPDRDFDEKCSEEPQIKMLSSMIEECKAVFRESADGVCKSIDAGSSQNKLIYEINERLDRLNEQVPHYRDDVQTAIKSSLYLNDDLLKRIDNIEKNCESLKELRSMPEIFKSKNQKIDFVLSNVKQLKCEVEDSLNRLEATIFANGALTQKLSAKSDDKMAQTLDTINGKIASMEGNFELMQNTLTEKVLTFCNVSDEIKEVSCGMRRISDNYEANNYPGTGYPGNYAEQLDLKLDTMCEKFNSSLRSLEESLKIWKEELATKLESISNVPPNNEETTLLMNEISGKVSDVGLRISKILQNQESTKEPYKSEYLQNFIFKNEKSTDDITEIVKLIYDLLKTFEHQPFGIDIKELTDKIFKLTENIPKDEDISAGNEEYEELSRKTNMKQKSNIAHSFSQTEGELNLTGVASHINALEDENRLLVAENQLLQKTIGVNQSKYQTPIKSLSSPSKRNEWQIGESHIEDELKSLKKLNRELSTNLSNLETDCDEMEEELELRDKEMQNQKKINSIQKKEIKDMRQQMAYIACVQNEKFSLEEQVIRLEHSVLEYKQIVEQLQAKVLELTRDNFNVISEGKQTGSNSVINQKCNSQMNDMDQGLTTAQNLEKDHEIESLFANIDEHFQSMVSIKLKELNEILEERLPQQPPSTASSVETYQRDMIKLRREIISMKEEIDESDCNKDFWRERYDDLHERYQNLQRKQPVIHTPVEEDCFQGVIETIQEQIKMPYPVSKFVESNHQDSDYFSSLRYSTNSGSSSMEPRTTERTFVSFYRPNFTPEEPPSTELKESSQVIPLFTTFHSEDNPVSEERNNNTSPGYGVEQSCERYIDFLQVKHSV